MARVEIEQKFNVAIKTNAKGECVDIVKVKFVNSAEYKELLKESNKHKELCEKQAQEEKKKMQEEIGLLFAKSNAQNLLIAKNYFDNLVDRGLCETNDDFESMFFNYIDKGIALDLNSQHIPPHYRKVLERLGE